MIRAQQKLVFFLTGNMLATKLFLCFAATFFICSGVESLYTAADVVKLTCESICADYLVGKTYRCDMYSSRGVVTAIVRMIMDLNWRFYVISKIQPEIRLCQRIAAADKYFTDGTNKCPAAFRSSTDEVDQIDPSLLQSNLRLEDMKDLLEELNKDSTDVLNDLEGSSNDNGLRSLKQTFVYSKTVKIKLVLKKLMERMTIVYSLKQDVTYHVNSNMDVSKFVHTSSVVNHTIYSNQIPYLPPHPSQHNYEPTFDDKHFSDYDHDTKFDSDKVHDYNIKGNNKNHNSYTDDRNYRTNYNYNNYGKRGSSYGQVDEVKQLANQLKKESSALLNQMKGSLMDFVSTGREKVLGSLVNHLNGFLGLVHDLGSNPSKTYHRAETDETESSNNSNNDSDDSSQSVEDNSPLEQTSNKRKFTHSISDEHGECVLCSVVLKDICSDANMIVCNEKICCWMPLNPYHCMSSLTDNSSITCYNSLFSILQSAKLH